MNHPSRAAIFDILNTWNVPGTSTSLVGLKAVKEISLDESQVTIALHLLDAYRDREELIRKTLDEKLRSVHGIEKLVLLFTWEKNHEVSFINLLPTVKAAVVVGSGKGGVGKSTVAANLACASARLGLNTGLLDADIYGPSLPMMFGIQNAPEGTPEGKIIPIEKFGLKLMSMGFLIDQDRPVIWRGPMLNKALTQFLGDVLWGDLDVLFIDLPPGTGDVQITLIQNAKAAMEKGGAVVVSTPQDIAFLDAKKAIGLFQTVEIPIIGIVENMSGFICPHCHTETHIFGHGRVRAASEQMKLPFLGEIPIDLSIRTSSDEGTPLVIEHQGSHPALIFMEMAKKLKDALFVLSRQ